MSGRLLRWVRILSAYFTAQTLTQLLGIAAGLLFVNFMPVRELALYTLAFSVITFFNFVTDLGTSTSLVYFFRRSQGDAVEMERYTAAVLSLNGWDVPQLPMKGGDIIARGVTAGPEVARILRAVEATWVAEDYPDAARVAALADQMIGRTSD